MIIYIRINELEKEFIDNPWKIKELYNLGIDYQSNTIDGIFEDKEFVVFDFRKYDINLSNRWNNYEVSAGDAGILIEIISKRIE